MNRQPKSGHPLRHLLHPPVPYITPGALERAQGFSQGPPSPLPTSRQPGHPSAPAWPPHRPAQGALSPNVTAGEASPEVTPAQLPPPGERSRWRSPGVGGSLGAGGAHMMVQRFLRRAPWKRMVVWTCLQRAQPTLLRSSLKSSRMCQLYLAEHSM